MSPSEASIVASASAASYRRSRRRYGSAFRASILALSLSACATTPVTGRQSLNLFSPEDDARLGGEAYAQILEGAELVRSGPEYEKVVRVMERLAAVADDPGYTWEVSLIADDSQVNAFALPGGKMAVYTGILPVCGTEAGLAVVMGHEIGHVVARHGTEQMTSSMGLEMGTSVLLSLLELGDYAQLAQLGTEYLVRRPFGRQHESEADEIGLVYMARAGYDPREALGFWERMSAATGNGPPEFLSTHPSHETRMERLQEKMPEALEIWQASRGPTAP